MVPRDISTLISSVPDVGDWGACRAHEGVLHAEQAVWRVQNVRGRKVPRARVGLTLTDSLHDPVSKPKPHGTGGSPGSPGKLYSDKAGWQGPEIFGRGWSCVDPSQWLGLPCPRAEVLDSSASSPGRVLLDLAGNLLSRWTGQENVRVDRPMRGHWRQHQTAGSLAPVGAWGEGKGLKRNEIPGMHLGDRFSLLTAYYVDECRCGRWV